MPSGKQPAQVLPAEAVLGCIVLQEAGGTLLPPPVFVTCCMLHSSVLVGHLNATVASTLTCTKRAPSLVEEALRCVWGCNTSGTHCCAACQCSQAGQRLLKCTCEGNSR